MADHPTDSRISNESSGSSSSFENLPSELFCEIIDYAPQSLFSLRLVSQLLKSRVNEYVLQRSHVVETLRVHDQVYGFMEICTSRMLRRMNIDFEETEEDDPAEIRFRMDVYSGMEQVFELRMKLLKSPFDLKKLMKVRERRTEKIFYYFLCNSLSAEELESGLKYLGECMGRHIGCVDYGLGNPISELPFADFLLEETQFRKFIVRIKFTIFQELADRISNIVKLHGVDDFMMIVHKIDPSVDSVEMLLDWSSYVRNLHINQDNLNEIDRDRNYFLGVFDADWGKIILEMFSNKLLYLNLFNFFYGNYLSKGGADSLIEKLPLMNKKICLWTSCKQFYGKTWEYSNNDHCIRAYEPESDMCVLSIIHCSRKSEKQSWF